MTRTFIALEQHEALQHTLSELIRKGRQTLPNLRWVDPMSIHLTLAFLGELTDSQLKVATEATRVAAEQVSPFAYRPTGLGTFGSPRQPRVLWAGIEEPMGALERLHRLLNRELERRDFETDKRPFSPHLTLARVKFPLTSEEQVHLARFLEANAKLPGDLSHRVHSLNVMKSELFRSGAQYTCLEACPLRKHT